MSRLYHSNRISKFLKHKLWVCFFIFMIFILPIFGSYVKVYAHHTDSQLSEISKLNISQENEDVNEDSIIFEGNASALDITDYGNSYQLDQEVSVNNESETRLEYYLDSQHGWSVSSIDNQISNLQDTRNWIKANNLKSPEIFKKDLISESAHPYENNRNRFDYNTTIYEPNAKYMRVHFEYIQFERYYDFLYVFDEYGNAYLIDDVDKTDFYSPWIPGEYINIGYYSDELFNETGYKIDFYEFLNDSSNIDINNNSWGFNYKKIGVNGTNGYGSGVINGTNGMHVDLFSQEYYHWNYGYQYGQFEYEDGAFSEIYQNFSIPRGKVVDAKINFDYCIERGAETNENFIYVEINDKRIYSIGMRDAIDKGKNEWFSSGEINVDLWVNTSNIFYNLTGDKKFNISVGIMSGSSLTYSNFEDGFQNIVWFDNLSLILTTIANSSQNDIDLTFDKNSLHDHSNWGDASIVLNEGWNSNPILLDINTSSPDLKFYLNSTLYGYHPTNSKLNQLSEPGSSYKILYNGTIYREFYHNLYMPAEYGGFEFAIDKPKNWKVVSALDPTLQSRNFEQGGFGDSSLKIPTSQAIYPGWWKFVAVSPNYLNLTKTKMLKDGNWVNSEFQSGDSTIIKTNVSNQGEIPDLQNTNCTLRIYNPEGDLWYTKQVQPNSTNGIAQFSRVTFASQNTTGGVYEYSIFWSNDIDVGGVRSSFTINHNSSMAILKPEDIEDYTIEGYYGDIIPLRLYLTDSEKDIPISEASIYYNFTNNETYSFEEVLPGVYDAIINTETFSGAGSYNFSIKTSRTGFITDGMELQLTLKERIDSNPLILPLLIVSIGAASILGALSFRSYVWLPKKRKEEEELMAKTQKFKDLQNIQAFVVIHKLSGIPLYTQGYSILEKQKRELFSGFIQAITTISEEFSGSKLIKDNRAKKQYGVERLIELDFKYFYCLIADQDDLRVVLILKNRASERLKEEVSYLCNALILKLSELFDHWDGSLNEFEEKIPDIIEDYFELYYKGDFELAHPKKIAKSRNQENLTTMETRVLNVIYSLSKNKDTFKLDYVLEIVSEQQKELIMLALEGLINRKIIVPAIIEEDNPN